MPGGPGAALGAYPLFSLRADRPEAESQDETSACTMDARHPTLLRRDEPQPPVGTAPRRGPVAPPFRPALARVPAPAPAPALPPPDPAALALLLRQADLDLDLVTGLIAPDPTLSARVLRLANSVTYNRGVPVRSLAEAVARLGFVPLLQLMNPTPAHASA